MPADGSPGAAWVPGPGRLSTVVGRRARGAPRAVHPEAPRWPPSRSADRS